MAVLHSQYFLSQTRRMPPAINSIAFLAHVIHHCRYFACVCIHIRIHTYILLLSWRPRRNISRDPNPQIVLAMSLTRFYRRKALGSRSQQYRVISKSEMFRLLSSVAEETPLHVQDIVRIPAVPEEEEMGFSISKDHNLSNGVFIPRINFKVWKINSCRQTSFHKDTNLWR